MFTIWPSTVWTSVAHPTEQNGQTLGVTFALAMRSSCARATTGARLTPDAIRPPSAVPLPPATERRRISRREISIAETPFLDDGRHARARSSLTRVLVLIHRRVHKSYHHTWHLPDITTFQLITARKAFIAVTSGFVTGAAAGLIGVGGGEFRIPVLVQLLGFPLKLAGGINLVIGLFTVVLGVFRRWGQHSFTQDDLVLMSIIACVSVAGTALGAVGRG